jgi:hypothetical protein
LGFLLAVLESTRPRYYAAFSAGWRAGSANETTRDELFSLLATATFARMMIVRTELAKTRVFAAVQPSLPVRRGCWRRRCW